MWLASVQQEDGDSDRETVRGGHNTHVTKGLLADALEQRLDKEVGCTFLIYQTGYRNWK